MRLLFVYNANSGFKNTVLDGLHKIVSPKTYSCNLCDVTYGIFSENAIWKDFRVTSDIDMSFYHKDEFLAEFKSKWLAKYDFPIILSEEKGDLQIFMTSEALSKIKNASVLIQKIKEAI